MESKQKPTKTLPVDACKQFLTISKVKLANNQYFESFIGDFLTNLIDKECVKKIHMFYL